LLDHAKLVRGRAIACLVTSLLLVVLFTGSNAGARLSSAEGAAAQMGTTINVPGDQPTLQAAVAAAAGGDTILLAPGTYQGGVYIQNKALTIASRFQTTGEASYIEQTVVSGIAANYCGGAAGCRGDALVEFGSNASGGAVVGLTITNGAKGVRSGSIVDISSSHVVSTSDGVNYTSGSGGTISNSLFANNGDDGIDLNDDVATHVVNNTIRDNRDDGIEYRVRSGSSPVTLEFTGNVITGNKEDGIQFIDSPDISPRTLRVERNVFSNNALAAIGVLAAGSNDTVEDLSGAPMVERMYVANNTFSAGNYGVVGGASAVVLNNIFVGAKGTAVRRVSGNSTVTYNLFWSNALNYDQSNVDSAHTLLADPLLNPDWTLGAGSPAIDAGTAFFQWQGETVLNLPPTSYQGSAPDLGAFESGGGPAPNTPPTVDAGADQTITLPADAPLDGTVSDDGRPNPPGALTTVWGVDSGPGSVTFANANAVDTRASFATAGAYVLRLTANDGALSASDTVQITVQAAGTGSVERRIATGTDDAEERATGSMYLNSSDIELVFDSNNQTDGLRFTNVPIPNHATITGAYVQFEADATQSETTNLVVQGQSADNAATFTSATRNVSSRPRTAASTGWTPQPWTLVGEAGAKQRTPGLSAVIQEIVNRPGWASGNALAIIITGTGHRTARAFEGKPAGAALLHVDYVSAGSSDAPPVARLGMSPTSGTAPLGVSADASGSTDTDSTPIASYTFDFGDGSAAVGPQAGATANHTYPTAGTFTVTVTVKDTAGLFSTATAQVRVDAGDAPPTAKLTVSPTSGSTPLGVSADASASTDTDSTPIASYTFDFGDGSAAVGPQTGAIATHTYTTAGPYTVTVTVKDTAGLSSDATVQVTVTDLPPSAKLTASPASGTAPLDVNADASASTDTDSTPIASYTFDFGDGSAAVGPQAGATANHTYTTLGTYTVTVTVKDTAGFSSTASAQVHVNPAGDAPPTARLTVSPASGSKPLGVSADASASTDTDSTPIAIYTFDFGDGSAAVGPQAGATATHTYLNAGNYTVTVTVKDTAGLSSTATAQVAVSGNVVGNPGFETDLSGWNSGSTTTPLTRVSGGHTGSWAAKVTNTGSSATSCTLNDSPNWVKVSSAGTYTGTTWVRADSVGAVLKLRFREYSGSTQVGSATTQVTLTTSWQLVSVTYSVPSAGTSLDFNAYISSAPSGTCFYADDAVIQIG
jgi:PKD repeat protein